MESRSGTWRPHRLRYELAVLESKKSILWECVVKQVQDVVAQLLLLLREVRAAHHADVDDAAQLFEERNELRCRSLSRRSESSIYINQYDALSSRCGCHPSEILDGGCPSTQKKR